MPPPPPLPLPLPLLLLLLLPLLQLLLPALPAAAAAAAGGGGGAHFDQRRFEQNLRMTIDFCSSSNFTDEACAERWIDAFSNTSAYFSNIAARLEFAFEVNMSEQLGQQRLRVSDAVQRWFLRHLAIAKRFAWRSFDSQRLRRRFLFLTDQFVIASRNDSRLANELQQQLQAGYSHATACPRGRSCLAAGEAAVQDALSNASATYDEKQEVWTAWYDTAGGRLRQNFSRYVSLMNSAARADGRRDAASAEWRADFESDTLDTDVLRWWAQVSDLYEQLHAYVRWRLAKKFPGRFRAAGCLPAHLLGDQWAQQWHLDWSDFPFPHEQRLNASSLLRRRFVANFTKMATAAEEFFVSLGLPAMTGNFWRRSDFLPPAAGVTKDCHASAMDFCDGSDFRIKMCGRVDSDNFYTVHHEMGHVQYFMAYSQQPLQFRSGANSGFHEAVGDTIALSVDTDAHYRRLRLLDTEATMSEGERINRLFKTALQKVAFLPFALSVSQFRWQVYNGSIGDSEYNAGWWRLRARLGGVCPPTDRPALGFDAGAKYHVALDISYVRYFFSFLLQFQLHERMCQLAGRADRLDDCDFYRSRRAGSALLRLLSLGSSSPWQQSLQQFCGASELQPAALLRYFRPLHRWLRRHNRRHSVPIGWTVPTDVLKGVSL